MMAYGSIILLALLGLFGVFVLPRLLGLAYRRYSRRRLIRLGRSVSWTEAIGRVRPGMGYIIIVSAGRDRDLFFVDGEMPDDPISVREAYDRQALLITGFPSPMTIEALQAAGVEGRCVEVNLEDFVD